LLLVLLWLLLMQLLLLLQLKLSAHLHQLSLQPFLLSLVEGILGVFILVDCGNKGLVGLGRRLAHQVVVAWVGWRLRIIVMDRMRQDNGRGLLVVKVEYGRLMGHAHKLGTERLLAVALVKAHICRTINTHIQTYDQHRPGTEVRGLRTMRLGLGTC
jgi:hypothetical protein